MSRVIGLTGGIGMGKTTAGEFLAEMGLPLIDTDRLARELVEPGEPALAEIQERFGQAVLDEEGRLNRGRLAEEVFADAGARRKLEQILHPRIRARWVEEVSHWRSGGVACGVVVIPLLFETGAEASFTETVCVACTEATQQARLSARGWTAEQIHARKEAQLPIHEKMARSTYVAWAEGPLDVLRRQLERVLDWRR